MYIYIHIYIYICIGGVGRTASLFGTMSPRKALRGGISKSILDRFVNFWQQFSTKWLQNRPQIPKPSPGMPPHRAFCGSCVQMSSRSETLG